jgi:hypothetical protein
MNDSPEFDSELHRTALNQLDRVASRLTLDHDIHERLRFPRRALVVSVPVRMDNGKTEATGSTTTPPSAPPRAACATISGST